MKLFIVAAIIGVCSAARLDNAYLPPRGGQGAGYGATGSGGSGGFGRGSSGFGQGSGGFGQGGSGGFGQGQGAYQGGGQGAYNQGGSGFGGGSGRSNSADANAQILKLNSEVTAEGFQYEYETSNGIRADASGVATNGVQSQGSFSYKGDDGQDYSITYTADENGFQPQGAHLPTPPPIPEAILKSLEQNARDEAAGIVDDGTYRGEGAGSGSGSGYGSGSGSGSGYGSGSGSGSGRGGYTAPSNQYGAPGFGNQGSSFSNQGSNFGNQGSSFGAKTSSFGNGAASRQYLAPNAGPRGSGNGNYNSQTGYRY